MEDTVPDYPRGITFEQIWAAIHADRIAAEARQEEVDREIQESRESRKELDRIVKETQRQLGKLGNRFGEMVEYMVIPNLIDKFQELNFQFTKAFSHAKIRDKDKRFLAEADITLENGDAVMLVEVKTKPTAEDVIDHVARIEKFRAYGDERNDTRRYMGAIAGVVMDTSVTQFAFKHGFYVIEPSGETFSISIPEAPYSPKEW